MKKKIIREVEDIEPKDFFIYSPRQAKMHAHTFSFQNLELVGSGKAGISLILRYMRKNGILPDRTYEILVPGWLGAWVYAEMNHFAFPSKCLSSKTKAIFMYHQYGFPQNINKLRDYADNNDLIIIEDCAHTLGGMSEGHQLGYIGEYSLYSFSKFFFCYALGALRSNNNEFLEYVRQKKQNVKRWITTFNNVSKAIYEYTISRSSKRLKSLALELTTMSYGLYGIGFKPLKKAEEIAKEKIDYEIEIRQKYYNQFREKTDKFGICDHLEKNYVYPYVIPIYVSDKVREKLVHKLQKNGFMTNIYHFDINRFFIEPDFKPCVPIFCHSGITESEFEHQIDVVLKVL